MYEEKDYILRLIHEIIRMIAKLALGKDISQDEEDALPPEVMNQYKTLSAMIDHGFIDSAEDALIENLDANDMQYFQMALMFYLQLNEKTEEYLTEHDFSKKEILDGIKYIVGFYGYGHILEAFTDDFEESEHGTGES